MVASGQILLIFSYVIWLNRFTFRFLQARRFLRKEPSLIKPKNRAADTQLGIVY